ncbi:MAG: nitroreductase family protein [Rikenellaceae bacterium]
MKKILKSIKQLMVLFSCSVYDFVRFVKYSSIFNQYSSEQKLASRIAMATHGIEKGLTMPKMRLDFGKDAIVNLIGMCRVYISKSYDDSNELFLHAFSVLNEYLELHKTSGLEPTCLKEIESILKSRTSIKENSQLKYTKETYFKHNNEDFKLFSYSRHSVRNFSEKKLDLGIINKSINMAMNTPSSCNRQVSRVHVVQDIKVKQEILKLQQGNRGFGYLADKIIIVTAHTEAYASGRERNSAYVDGGMFGMNLLYSLHYNKVGCCVLNCYFTPRNECRLRKIVGIHKSEVPIMIILVGDVNQEFSVAYSVRQSNKSITSVH